MIELGIYRLCRIVVANIAVRGGYLLALEFETMYKHLVMCDFPKLKVPFLREKPPLQLHFYVAQNTRFDRENGESKSVADLYKFFYTLTDSFESFARLLPHKVGNHDPSQLFFLGSIQKSRQHQIQLPYEA